MYEGKDKWYYRQKVEGERRYLNRIIPNAVSLEEAREGVLEVAFKVQAELSNPSHEGRQVKSSNKRTPITTYIKRFLEEEQTRVEIEEIGAETNKRTINYMKHLGMYLEHKGVTYPQEITVTTFIDYPLFRKGCSKLTINNEMVVIKSFLSNHLAREKVVDPEVLLSKDVLKQLRIRQDELVANPAITPADWRLINLWTRGRVDEAKALAKKEYIRPQIELWRRTFWTFTMVMKNSGLRPIELRNLKWKHVDDENIGRINSKGKKVDEWVSHIYVARSKTARSRLVPTNKNVSIRLSDFRVKLDHYCDMKGLRISRDSDYIFGVADKGFTYRENSQFDQDWQEMREDLKDVLQGNRFSDKPYTLYSMRSTYIENQLANGVDVYLVARACGHDVSVLQKHYDRMDIQRRARELTKIHYGKDE
jgi:integrase